MCLYGSMTTQSQIELKLFYRNDLDIVIYTMNDYDHKQARSLVNRGTKIFFSGGILHL